MTDKDAIQNIGSLLFEEHQDGSLMWFRQLLADRDDARAQVAKLAALLYEAHDYVGTEAYDTTGIEDKITACHPRGYPTLMAPGEKMDPRAGDTWILVDDQGVSKEVVVFRVGEKARVSAHDENSETGVSRYDVPLQWFAHEGSRWIR